MDWAEDIIKNNKTGTLSPSQLEAFQIGFQWENEKGHAQHIAFVLQFGKFCGLNRMFLHGDLR
jgi:hypothetical protein